MGSSVPEPSGRQLIRRHLIVALDHPTVAGNRQLLERIGDRIEWVKVGPPLLIRSRGKIVPELVDAGRRVFLDCKFHDIPNTVAQSVRAACEQGVALCTVHAAGGRQMLEAAARASRDFGMERTRILAITVLTSRGSEDVAAEVEMAARLARGAGCDGVICSPLEAAAVRRFARDGGGDFLVVTPGIRFGQSADDQARVASPARAIKEGADLIVVGRPIYRADDPAAVVDAIERDLERL